MHRDNFERGFYLRNCKDQTNNFEYKFYNKYDKEVFPNERNNENWVREDKNKTCQRKRVRGPKYVVIKLKDGKKSGSATIAKEYWALRSPLSIAFLSGVISFLCLAMCIRLWLKGFLCSGEKV